MDNEIKSMPMVPLRGMTILPEMVVHFDVSRQRSIAAVQEAMRKGRRSFWSPSAPLIQKIRMRKMCLRSVQWRRSADHPSPETDPEGYGCRRTPGTSSGN